MTAKGYMNDFYKQFEKLNKNLEKANDTIAKMSFELSCVRQELKESLDLNKKLEKQNQDLLLEIERLKNNNNKNSSNSGKPSSTNGYKKVITNNREKSNRKKGAQPNHEGKTLTNQDIEKMINNGEINEVIVIEENKNENNKYFNPIIRYEYDIEIRRIVKKHIIYPDVQTNIKNYPVVYGNNIKVIECLLNQKYMSLDSVQSFLYDSTNNQLLTSKGSFYAWNKDIYNKLLKTEYSYIQDQLLNSLVLNVDESPVKIDGDQYYLHNISNGTHTLQYVTKHRSQDDIDDFGFLKKYKGILVHDHYKMYYNYGADNAECNVHVLRYLNAVTEFTNHTWAKELKELFLEMKNLKEQYQSQNKKELLDNEYENFKSRYLEILSKGRIERNKDLSTNAYKKEEINLLNRLEKYCDNHLLFLKKFFVPFSNNRAESDLRGIKIKQKTGKFRSIEGACRYAVIKSCVSTYIKNKINAFNALISLLNGNPILV